MMPPFAEIKNQYERLLPIILKAGNNWVDPYSLSVDFVKYFSPIEKITWESIRTFAKLPMYPQFPVDKFFLDFANPLHKIAIECDGEDYHDKNKDAIRDSILENQGWMIFRISGSDCNYSHFDLYDDQYKSIKERSALAHNMYERSIEGLLKSLAVVFAGYKLYPIEEYQISMIRNCLLSRCSQEYKIENLLFR